MYQKYQLDNVIETFACIGWLINFYINYISLHYVLSKVLLRKEFLEMHREKKSVAFAESMHRLK